MKDPTTTEKTLEAMQNWMNVDADANNSKLKQVYSSVLGGVGAISPDLYEKALEIMAAMCERELDDDFREEVRVIGKSMPCPID